MLMRMPLVVVRGVATPTLSKADHHIKAKLVGLDRVHPARTEGASRAPIGICRE